MAPNFTNCIFAMPILCGIMNKSRIQEEDSTNPLNTTCNDGKQNEKQKYGIYSHSFRVESPESIQSSAQYLLCSSCVPGRRASHSKCIKTTRELRAANILKCSLWASPALSAFHLLTSLILSVTSWVGTTVSTVNKH